MASPLDGRIGQAAFSVGAVVGPSSNPLARVVQVDPIRVVFSISDRTLVQLRESAGNPTLEQLYRKFVPRLRLPTGTIYDQIGKIDFVENQVDPQTGTIAVRARFSNPNGILTAGQFVNVLIADTNVELRPVVPLGAVQQDREGRFVLLVENGRVIVRRIKTGPQVGQNLPVQEGLQGGETLILEGLQNARADQNVRAVPASEIGAVLPVNSSRTTTGGGGR
jgi:membrane fusion protein (multidrug efflux system)